MPLQHQTRQGDRENIEMKVFQKKKKKKNPPPPTGDAIRIHVGLAQEELGQVVGFKLRRRARLGAWESATERNQNEDSGRKNRK
jgi:hypothetical protein